MFQRASTSLVLIKVNALLPVIYETELAEFKKVKVCWPIICKLNHFVSSQFGFFLPEVGIGLQLTKYYEVLIQTVPQLLMFSRSKLNFVLVH